MGLGSEWLDLPLGAACLLVGLHHLGLLGTRRVLPLDAAAHAVMGLGMAAMFVPSVDPVPQWAWVAAFVVIGAWFGAAALRAGTVLGAPGHHAVGAVAMLFMLLGGHDHSAAAGAGGPVDPEHAHHAGADGASPGLLVTVVALVLLAWFVADVVRVLTSRAPAPAPVAVAAPVPGSSGAPAASGTGAVALSTAPGLLPAHVVMSAAMVVMLLGMA